MKPKIPLSRATLSFLFSKWNSKLFFWKTSQLFITSSNSCLPQPPTSRHWLGPTQRSFSWSEVQTHWMQFVTHSKQSGCAGHQPQRHHDSRIVCNPRGWSVIWKLCFKWVSEQKSHDCLRWRKTSIASLNGTMWSKGHRSPFPRSRHMMSTLECSSSFPCHVLVENLRGNRTGLQGMCYESRKKRRRRMGGKDHRGSGNIWVWCCEMWCSAQGRLDVSTSLRTLHWWEAHYSAEPKTPPPPFYSHEKPCYFLISVSFWLAHNCLTSQLHLKGDLGRAFRLVMIFIHVKHFFAVSWYLTLVYVKIITSIQPSVDSEK